MSAFTDQLLNHQFFTLFRHLWCFRSMSAFTDQLVHAFNVWITWSITKSSMLHFVQTSLMFPFNVCIYSIINYSVTNDSLLTYQLLIHTFTANVCIYWSITDVVLKQLWLITKSSTDQKILCPKIDVIVIKSSSHQMVFICRQHHVVIMKSSVDIFIICSLMFHQFFTLFRHLWCFRLMYALLSHELFSNYWHISDIFWHIATSQNII